MKTVAEIILLALVVAALFGTGFVAGARMRPRRPAPDPLDCSCGVSCRCRRRFSGRWWG